MKEKDSNLIRASRTLDENGKVIISSLPDTTIIRCREITKGIKDSASLKKFGSDLIDSSNECTSSLLEINKLDKAGDAGKYIKDLVDVIRKNDLKNPDNLTGWRKIVAKLPIIGTSAVLSADKIMDRYESSKGIVSKIMDKVKDMEIDLGRDMNTLTLMEERAKDLSEYYGIHVVALAVLQEDEKQELLRLQKENEENPGTHSVDELEAKREFIEKIDRHGFDLFMAGQKTHNLDLPQIKLMKKNNERLRENAEQIYRVIIPNWEMSIAIAIMNNKQKAILDTQRLMKDVNNKLTESNAKLMKTTSSQILVEGSRSVIDVSSYRKAMDDVFSALTETTQKLAALKEQRDNDRRDIMRIGEEISKKMESLRQEADKLTISDNFTPKALI